MSARRVTAFLLVLAIGSPAGLASAELRHDSKPQHHHRHRRPRRAVPPPARMLVYAQEWSLWPSRTTVPVGAVVVQLWNRGQDAHDLVIKRLSHGHMTGPAQNVNVTASGAISQASWRLSPGTYELFCSMPGHLARGMHTVLHVK